MQAKKNYGHTDSVALLWYDYALTFPMEVEYIWGERFRLTTFLYILCRYALPANILYLLAISKHLGTRVGSNLIPQSNQDAI